MWDAEVGVDVDFYDELLAGLVEVDGFDGADFEAVGSDVGC